MDMHMPVMDGLEAAAKINAMNAGVPIVAMTANIMMSDREIYKVSGMHDFVGKPFTSQELWQCLLKYFKPVSWQTMDAAQNVRTECALQKKLISNFMNDYRDRNREFQNALNAGDIQLAHRMVHTLKSNAGQLGKAELQQAAAEVENQLKDGTNQTTPEQLARLEKALSAVLAEFALLSDTKDMEAKTPDANLSAEVSLELLAELEPLLVMGKPECRELIDRLRQIPGSEEVKNRLIRQMDDLDFEPAIAALAELRSILRE